MRMLDASGGACFAEKPVAPGRIGRTRLLVVEQLDRHVTLEPPIEGAVDPGYTPGTDDLVEFVPIGEDACHRGGQRVASVGGALRRGSGGLARLEYTGDRMIVSAAV
jgi:hypothetical protein